MENDNTRERQSDEDAPYLSANLQGAASTSSSNAPSQAPMPDEEAVPTEVVEALKELPPDQRQMVTSLFLSMGRISSSSSSSLAKRVTAEHITQTLNNLEKENERDFKKVQANEITKRLGMGAILVLVLMVLGYAGVTKDKELAEKVIIAGISGLGGFGAGVAVSKRES